MLAKFSQPSKQEVEIFIIDAGIQINSSDEQKENEDSARHQT
jgi:hypothetical protein